MKIISALGGTGSTFIIRSLEEENYQPLFGKLDSQRIKRRYARNVVLAPLTEIFLRVFNGYTPRFKILLRPDVFWSLPSLHEQGIYDPSLEAVQSTKRLQEDLRRHRDFIVETQDTRSGGINISEADISINSMTSLVKSYLEKMEKVERENKFTIVLITVNWGVYGVLKDLNVETIYLIRDPFNSLISMSKGIRHKEDFLELGLHDINTIEWIDAYLTGPYVNWIGNVRNALAHENSTIVRYNHFANDWKKVKGLPDISSKFVYKENNIEEILTKESISYIRDKTQDICEELAL